MDEEQDTDTYSQKKYNHIVYENIKLTTRLRQQLWQTTQTQRESERSQQLYVVLQTSRSSIMHNAHNGRVQLIINQAVYAKNGNISVKHRSRRANDGKE